MNTTNLYSEERSVLDFSNRSQKDKEHSLKRVYEPAMDFEKGHYLRTNPFEEDANVIRNSPLYRMLKSKSMLAPTTRNLFQNRGSHTFRVAEIADAIARGLKLGEESRSLIKTTVYMHDLGHPPFSHEGEIAFNKKLQPYGLKWNHDYAGLEFATELAHQGLSYPGLNLTLGTLECATRQYHTLKGDLKEHGVPQGIITLNESAETHLYLDKFAPIEGQIIAVADWVGGKAVNDIEEWMRVHLYREDMSHGELNQLFESFADHFPPAREVWDKMKLEFKDFLKSRPHQKQNGYAKRSYATRMEALMTQFTNNIQALIIEDVIQNTQQNIKENISRIKHAEDIRNLEQLTCCFSPKMMGYMKQFETFCKIEVYPKLASEYIDTEQLVGILFDDYFTRPEQFPMPNGWHEHFQALDENEILSEEERNAKKAYLVCQFITCNFTDSDALWHVKEHHPEEFAELSANALPAPEGYYPAPSSLIR
jgi:dGTP triphosphohydrolase